MRARTALLLAGLGVASLAGGWYFGIRTEPAEQSQTASGTLVFPGLAQHLQDAARIEVSSKGKTLVIARNEAGSWGLADRHGYPVEPNKLRGLLTGLTELRIIEPRTSDPTEYARLGVEDPASPTATAQLLRVLDASGKPIAELITGHRRVRTQGNLPEAIYIRRVGQPQAWLAEGRLEVESDPMQWIDRDISNIDHSRINSVTVQRGDEHLLFGRNGDKLTLMEPRDHPKLDEYRLDDIARALESLTLMDVKPQAEEPGEKLGTAAFVTTSGLTVTATVFKAGSDIWAQFQATGERDATAEASTLQKRLSGWAYQLSTWKEQALVPTMAELKATEPEKPEAAPAAPAAPPAAATPAPGAAPAKP
jgi:hypothetical protein